MGGNPEGAREGVWVLLGEERCGAEHYAEEPLGSPEILGQK